MKAPQFYISAGLGLLCLIFSVTNVVLDQSNGELQSELNQLQEEINQGNSSNQALQNILRELANASTRSDKIKDLLQRNGFTVQQATPTTPAAQ